MTQFGDEPDESVIFQAECPPQGHCRSVLEALIMANNLHDEHEGTLKVGCEQRISGGLSNATMEGNFVDYGRRGERVNSRTTRR